MGCVIKIGNQSVSETDFLNHLNKIININKLFEENPEFSSQIYEALGFKTIPSDISKIKNFEGTIIEYVEHIGTHKDGRGIGARNINKGEKIQVVLNEMRKKFEEKSWVNPVNSEPLSQDAFSSFEELMMFMYLHEKAHEYILQKEGESLKSYETRVNNEALQRLNSEFKITPQQKQQATFMFSEFLDVYLQDFEQVERVLKEENVIEKDCTGGIKAENGLQTNFTKGGKWEIYEIFEGKSHKQGGIDINIKNNQISFTNKNGSIKAKYGLVISKDN